MIKNLIFLFFCHFTVDLFSGIWPVYKTIGQLDLVRAGLIAMIGGMLGNMMQIVFGFMGDCGYRRKCILLGLFLTSAGCLYPYTQSYLILALLVFAKYIGSSAFHPSGTAMVGTLTKNRKGLAISAFIACGTAGFALSQIIFREAYSYFNGHTAIILVLPAASLAMASLMSHECKSGVKSTFVLKTEITRLLHECKGPIFILYVIEVCLAAAITGFIFILPELMHAKGFSRNWCFGGAHMLFVIGSSIIIVPAGHISDKTSQKLVMIVALVVTLILYYLFLYTSYTNLMIFVPMMLCLGGVMGICNPVGVALGNRLAPGQESKVSALLMGFAWGSGSFSTLLVGYLSKAWGSPITAMYYIGIFVAIALVLTLFIPGRHKVIEIVAAHNPLPAARNY